MIKIRFTQATMTVLIEALHRAYASGNLRLVKRISALLDVAKDEAIQDIADKYGVARQTVYRWIAEFFLEGTDSLRYEKSSGRKPRLTKTQKARLKEVVKAGPQAAGFGTACWTSLLIQIVIYREFKVLYSRHYVCQLLRTWTFPSRKPGSCPITWMKSVVRSGWRKNGPRFCAKPGKCVLGSSSGTKPVSPNGAR